MGGIEACFDIKKVLAQRLAGSLAQAPSVEPGHIRLGVAALTSVCLGF